MPVKRGTSPVIHLVCAPTPPPKKKKKKERKKLRVTFVFDFCSLSPHAEIKENAKFRGRGGGGLGGWGKSSNRAFPNWASGPEGDAEDTNVHLNSSCSLEFF